MATQEANLEQLIEQLSNLTVLEMSKLKEALEDKWGVKAAAAQAVIAAPAAGGSEEKAEESTEFKITLEEFPADKKIAIIKVVREIIGLGLKEAKDLVEKVPGILKETAPKAEADEIVKKIQAAGGKAVAKGL